MPLTTLERRGPVTVLRLERPEVLNAIDEAMLAELEAHERELAADAGCRALVLTGAGRGFCAGTDLRNPPPDPAARIRRVHALIGRLLAWPKPSIAALNGLALGGGLELALACTFRVARADASLGLPEVKLGLLPAYGGTQLLPRVVGEGRALALMLSGEPVDGTEAARIGLVDRVVAPGEDVIEAACAFAAAFTRHSLVAQRAILRAVREGAGLALGEALALEREIVAEASASEDTREGISAFVERRAPSWKDR